MPGPAVEVAGQQLERDGGATCDGGKREHRKQASPRPTPPALGMVVGMSLAGGKRSHVGLHPKKQTCSKVAFATRGAGERERNGVEPWREDGAQVTDVGPQDICSQTSHQLPTSGITLIHAESRRIQRARARRDVEVAFGTPTM